MNAIKTKLGILGLTIALTSAVVAAPANAAIIIGGAIAGQPIVIGLGAALLLSQTGLFTSEASGGLMLIALDEKGNADHLDRLAQGISAKYGASKTDASAVAEIVYNGVKTAASAVESGQPQVPINISAADLARVTSSEFQATPGYGQLVSDLN